MTATMSQPSAGVSFAKTKAQAQSQPSEVAQALGRVLRLCEARSRAWCSRQPTGHLTAALEVAWADLRAARAMLSADKPPADHRRVERRITITDRRYHGRDCALDRFLLDRCVSDSGGRVSLCTFASELHAYTADDPAERADLPTSRQLAGLLRDRGIACQRIGGSVYLVGVRLSQDETCETPRGNSDCQSDGEARSSERHETAGRTGEGGMK